MSNRERRSAPNLEQQRKRAKELRRAHRDGSVEAAERIARQLPRARGLSAAQVLAMPFPLAEAQLVVAREAGHASWLALKRSAVAAAPVPGEADIVEAALAGRNDEVDAALARDPGAAGASLVVAAITADADAALALLAAEPDLANRPSGRRGWPPLLYLCCGRYRAGDAQAGGARLRIASRLLELGADVNAVGREPGYTAQNVTVFDEHSWTAIEGAAGRAASPELLRLLLEAGANPKTAALLSWAVTSGNPEILHLSLGAGPPRWQLTWALKACVELDRPEMARVLVAATTTARSLEPALNEAIRRERTANFIEILLGDGHSEMSRQVWQAVHAAAVRHGHLAAAGRIRERGVDEAAVRAADRLLGACMTGDHAELERGRRESGRVVLTRDDHRLLAWAIRRGRHQAVPLLLELGLDPNVPDRDGETPLHLAVRASARDLVDLLLGAGARPDERDLDGHTPLELVMELPDADARERLAERLLQAGASLVVAPDREDMDELFERAADAVAFGDLEGLRALLEEEPALVNARSPRPHRATLLNYCGANGTEAPRQRTPANAPAIAQLLLERGADPNAECRFYGGGVDTMGLMLTSGFPREASLDGELARVLARGGARIETVAGEGPMVTAIAYGLRRAAEALSEAGVPVEDLLVAAALDRVEVLEAMLDGGADVNARFSRDITALHAAAGMGHRRAVALLLERGADPRLRESLWGGTPAENAAHVGFHDIAAEIDRGRA